MSKPIERRLTRSVRKNLLAQGIEPVEPISKSQDLMLPRKRGRPRLRSINKRRQSVLVLINRMTYQPQNYMEKVEDKVIDDTKQLNPLNDEIDQSSEDKFLIKKPKMLYKSAQKQMRRKTVLVPKAKLINSIGNRKQVSKQKVEVPKIHAKTNQSKLLDDEKDYQTLDVQTKVIESVLKLENQNTSWTNCKEKNLHNTTCLIQKPVKPRKKIDRRRQSVKMRNKGFSMEKSKLITKIWNKKRRSRQKLESEVVTQLEQMNILDEETTKQQQEDSSDSDELPLKDTLKLNAKLMVNPLDLEQNLCMNQVINSSRTTKLTPLPRQTLLCSIPLSKINEINSMIRVKPVIIQVQHSDRSIDGMMPFVQDSYISPNIFKSDKSTCTSPCRCTYRAATPVKFFNSIGIQVNIDTRRITIHDYRQKNMLNGCKSNTKQNNESSTIQTDELSNKQTNESTEDNNDKIIDLTLSTRNDYPLDLTTTTREVHLTCAINPITVDAGQSTENNNVGNLSKKCSSQREPDEYDKISIFTSTEIVSSSDEQDEEPVKYEKFMIERSPKIPIVYNPVIPRSVTPISPEYRFSPISKTPSSKTSSSSESDDDDQISLHCSRFLCSQQNIPSIPCASNSDNIVTNSPPCSPVTHKKNNENINSCGNMLLEKLKPIPDNEVQNQSRGHEVIPGPNRDISSNISLFLNRFSNETFEPIQQLKKPLPSIWDTLSLTPIPQNVHDFEYILKNFTNSHQSKFVNRSHEKIPRYVQHIFGYLCFRYLKSNCSTLVCRYSHTLISNEKIFEELKTKPAHTIEMCYKFVNAFDPLFKFYCSIFCELFAKDKKYLNLLGMIKDCERLNRTTKCYKYIVNGLTLSGVSNVEAVRAVLQNGGMQTKEALNDLFELIIDFEVTLLFLPEIEFFLSKKDFYISISNGNKLLEIANTTKNLELISIVLKSFTNYPIEFMGQLDRNFYKTFLQMVRHLQSR